MAGLKKKVSICENCGHLITNGVATYRGRKYHKACAAKTKKWYEASFAYMPRTKEDKYEPFKKRK